MQKNGFVRAKIDGEVYELSDDIELDRNKKHNIDIIVDRLVIKKEARNRLAESVEVAMQYAGSLVKIDVVGEDSQEEIIGKELNIALEEALEKFIQMKEIEGAKLVEDIEKRIENVQTKVEEISNYSSNLIQEYIVRLEARVKELLNTDIVDENRLAQEIVIYSDKCSIEEELTRLRSHIAQFKRLLKETSPIGKKFDFLVQEMNRETNTIGSKANCLEITNRVIDIKTELENIREQIQNIE